MAGLGHYQEDDASNQQYEYHGLITSIFQSRIKEPDEEMVNSLQDALHNLIAQESEEYNKTKEAFENEKKEIVYLRKSATPGRDVDHLVNETTDKDLECSNMIRKHPKSGHVSIIMDGTSQFHQEINIQNVSDVVLSINNSATRDSFQDFQSGTKCNHDKTAVLGQQTDTIVTSSGNENLDTISKYKETTESMDQVDDTFKAPSDADNEVSDVGKHMDCSADTNCSANGHDSASEQKEEAVKNDGKLMEATGIKYVDPSESDTDNTAVDLTNIDTKEQGILKNEDDYVKYKVQTDSGEVKLGAEDKDQSKELEGICHNPTYDKIEGISENLEAYEERCVGEVEKTISPTDLKRRGSKIEENEEIEISQEERKQDHRSTTVLRVSVKNVNDDFDSNTESADPSKSDADDTVVDPRNIVTKEQGILKDEDSDVKYKVQTDSGEVKLGAEDKDQSKELEGICHNPTCDKIEGNSENLEAYEGRCVGEVEKTILPTDLKRRGSKIEENGEIEISQEERKQDLRSTTVLRVSVKNVNDDFDSNTESADPSKSDADDTVVDPRNIVTKEQGILKGEDSDVKFKIQTDSAEVLLRAEETDQSKEEGNSHNPTDDKIEGVSESLKINEGKGVGEVEDAILNTDLKRRESINDEEVEISQDERKQEYKSTTVRRISVRNVNDDFDSHTESGHFVKNDIEEQKVQQDSNDTPELSVNENILYAKKSANKESVEKLSLKDLAFGIEGYKHFKLYREIDSKIQVDELQDAKEALRMNYDWRIQQIDEIINVAKEYYKNPKNSKAVSEWHELKKTVSQDKRSAVKSNTDIKFHLASLHEHRTIFTYILIAMQLVSVVVTCILGKLTYIGLEPKLELKSGVKTFMGTEMIHKWIPPNVWIGPEERYLISIGALYAPCMREDFDIQIDFGKDRYSKTSVLGCCEVARRNVAGTTTQSECENSTNGVGVWKEGVVCSKRPSGQNSVGHVLKPCCTGLRGQCQLLSHEHCQFLEGTFHVNGPEHCSQVNCLSSVCGMGGLEADPTRPWLPREPIQWWRLPLSLVYHHGVIHAVLVSLAQLLLFRKIEQTLGWLRLMFLYLMTGLGGLLTAAIFSPYIPHAGGTATVFGMAGLITAELVHYWHLVRNPAVELTKICGLLVIFLMCGTLPYIDNYSIISGFLLGFFCSVLFLPFLSFKKQQKHCRIILLCLCGPFIFLVYFFLFYVFYKVQTFEECYGCKLFNCVPYTETMCDLSLWDDE